MKTDGATWNRAQELELAFHRRNKWRQSDDFMRDTRALFASFDLSANACKGKTVIDLGAGSRLRTRYFEGARIIAVEPLADKYIQIEWCDLKEAAVVYPLPAEERVKELEGAADLLVCVNVLDHCRDVQAVIDNIACYLAPGGIAALSFDARESADEMHPLVLDDKAFVAAFGQAGLIADRLPDRGGYSGEGYALNYILKRKRETA